jgi:hypothetical protein
VREPPPIEPPFLALQPLFCYQLSHTLPHITLSYTFIIQPLPSNTLSHPQGKAIGITTLLRATPYLAQKKIVSASFFS